MGYIILWTFLAVARGLPTVEFIIWLEVNYYGRTIMPEIYIVLIISMYLIWRVLWLLLTLETKRIGNRKVIM